MYWRGVGVGAAVTQGAVEQLLAEGHDVDGCDDDKGADGRTPIDVARQHRPESVAVLERLLEA